MTTEQRPMEPVDTTEPKSPTPRSLADRLAAARADLGERVKAARDAAPGAVEGARARLSEGVQGLRRIDVSKIKLDRASLGAKVEQLLKPRAPDGAPPPAAEAPPPVTAPAAGSPSVAEPATTRTISTPTARVRERVRRPFVTLGMVLTALVTGGILHILTVFGVIALGNGSAFQRLRWQFEPNTMRVLPVDPTGAMPLPFLSPDMRYAICRFDITNGPVLVSAQLPEVGWSLALYTPQGDNFYATPGQEGRVIDATFTLNTAADRVLIPVPGQRRADVDAALVTSPTREGLVVVRAPLKGASFAPLVERTLAAAKCQSVGRR